MSLDTSWDFLYLLLDKPAGLFVSYDDDKCSDEQCKSDDFSAEHECSKVDDKSE